MAESARKTLAYILSCFHVLPEEEDDFGTDAEPATVEVSMSDPTEWYLVKVPGAFDNQPATVYRWSNVADSWAIVQEYPTPDHEDGEEIP